MLSSQYGPVLALPAVRRALLLGFVVRLPMFSVGVVLTLHVVLTLGRSYAAAGLASGVLLVGVGLAGPWRGRLVDRHGLRAVVGPCVAVQAVAAGVAPFVGYELLLVVAGVAGLFTVPGHSLVRQALLTAIPPERTRSALSLDGMALELSAALGPAVAVWAATTWPTRWVLLVVLVLGALGGALLWVQDLPIHAEAPAETIKEGRRDWLGARFLVILLACAATTVVLSATDLGIVAMLREQRRESLIGVVIAVWALGSMVGGLLYGARQRSVDLRVLLAALAVLTALPALAWGPWSLAVAVALAGALCQPTITAGVELLTALVPDRSRGEALGWHGTSMTSGSALGAPLAGLAIDWHGPPAAFLMAAALGLAVAALGLVVGKGRSGRRPRWAGGRA